MGCPEIVQLLEETVQRNDLDEIWYSILKSAGKHMVEDTDKSDREAEGEPSDKNRVRIRRAAIRKQGLELILIGGTWTALSFLLMMTGVWTAWTRLVSRIPLDFLGCLGAILSLILDILFWSLGPIDLVGLFQLLTGRQTKVGKGMP